MDKGDYMQLLAMARAHDQPARSSARGGGSRRPRTAGTVSGTGSRRAQRLDEKYGGGGCGWLNTFDRELPPPFGRCSAATIRKFNDNMLQERFGEIRKVKGAGKAGGAKKKKKKASSSAAKKANGEPASPSSPETPQVRGVGLGWSPAKSYHAYLRGNWGGAGDGAAGGAGGARESAFTGGLSKGFPGMRSAPSYTFGERLKDPLARDERDTPGFRLVDEAFSHTSKCYRPPAFTMQGRWKEPADLTDEREPGDKRRGGGSPGGKGGRRNRKGVHAEGSRGSVSGWNSNPTHKIGGYSVKMMPFGSKNLRRRYQM